MLLERHGLEIIHLYRASVHGGSLIVYVGHKDRWARDPSVDVFRKEEKLNGYDDFYRYQVFGKEVSNLRNRIVSMVNEIKGAGKTIFAFGAPAKGTVLLNYCDLSKDEIEVAVEKNPMKIGLFIPGTGIEIVDENEVNEPDYYLLLAWNFAEEFINSEPFLSGKRRFLVPIPYPRIISN